MPNKLVVLSIDALVREDVDYLFQKPHFSRLFADCAMVDHAQSIYPSITYPAHVSIITGCRPGRHGVIDNTQWSTVEGGPHDWIWNSSNIQVEDLFAAAKRAGCSTAAVFWPVTGCNPHIDYLINETFPESTLGEEGILSVFSAQGSNEQMLDVIRHNMSRFPVANCHVVGVTPDTTYDSFLMGCACDVIRQYKPDLIAIHNCYIDTTRHNVGVFHDQVRRGLDVIDESLGELTRALEEAGVLEETNFALISDHGQLDFSRRIRLNVKLVRDGFIRLAPDGSIDTWRAFVRSTGMSAQVFLSDPSHTEEEKEILRYLRTLAAEGVWGFDTVYTREEVRDTYGLDGNFSFVLETDGYTVFADSWHEPICNPIDLTDYRLGMATHGYAPEKGPQPVFVGRGPDFRPGARLNQACIIDEGPTFAVLLGTSLPQAEGRCLYELLK